MRGDLLAVPSAYAVRAYPGQYDAGTSRVPDSAEPARPPRKRRVPRMGSPTSLPDRIQRRSGLISTLGPTPRARHRDMAA
ncbi:hypothetical protein GCM10009610_64060 [Pseudonocardia xinjiangensis]